MPGKSSIDQKIWPRKNFKTRLVPKVFSQKHEINFVKNYSPAAKFFFRNRIAYGIQNCFTVYQLNFIMAYVNGYLTKER